MTAPVAVFELFELPVVQRSAVALLVASIALPVIGVFVIGLDVIMARFAMMHIALFGVALGLLISVDPFACALVLCGASLAPLANRPGGLAGPMSLLMSLGIAGALLIFSISGVNANSTGFLLALALDPATGSRSRARRRRIHAHHVPQAKGPLP